MSPKFSAADQCPECGVIAVHYLDEPALLTDQEIAAYEIALEDFEENPGTAIEMFGGGVVRYVGGSPKPAPLIDESVFEVMRICAECGHRWGIAG